VTRFCAAFLALQPNIQVLQSTGGMKGRPMTPLLESLLDLGADVQYLGEEGLLPVSIGDALRTRQQAAFTSIDARVSSQFASALLLIAPVLEKGLQLRLDGALVSSSYIDMTLALMKKFGASVLRHKNTFTVQPGGYNFQKIKVESDWSAASYFLALATRYDEVDVYFPGLLERTIQGDAKMLGIIEVFGVEGTFDSTGLRITRGSSKKPKDLVVNCLDFPDLAPTLAFMGMAHAIPTKLTGLQTLTKKESNRITALRNELSDLGAVVDATNESLSLLSFDDEGSLKPIKTYEDHRMAMGASILSTAFDQIPIANPMVVAKSYPDYWRELANLGFQLE